MRRRSSSAGFVLMDALVAFAIAALALTLIVAALPNSAVRQGERLLRYQAMEFAFSILEEYRVTFPEMPLKGETAQGWAWTVTEVDQPTNRETGTPLIKYVDVTVTAWRKGQPDLRATLQATIARRAE